MPLWNLKVKIFKFSILIVKFVYTYLFQNFSIDIESEELKLKPNDSLKMGSKISVLSPQEESKIDKSESLDSAKFSEVFKNKNIN